MVHHNKNLSNLKNLIEKFEISEGNNLNLITENANSNTIFDNQQLILNNILHCADISNPAKISKVYKKWVDLVFIEFFNQGDMEKKQDLPISLLCDRETTIIPKCQIGFIKFVVKPSFDVLKIISPEINTYCDNIIKNLKMYEEEVKKMEVDGERSKIENKGSSRKF